MCEGMRSHENKAKTISRVLAYLFTIIFLYSDGVQW